MLEHRYRFHGHGSLNFLYRRGQTARGKSLSIRTVPNPQRVHARVAVVVSKKVCKSAPGRNRIRRRIFEVLRNNWSHISNECDIVVTVFDAHMLVMPHTELTETVLGMLKQARLWVEHPVDPEDK